MSRDHFSIRVERLHNEEKSVILVLVKYENYLTMVVDNQPTDQ